MPDLKWDREVNAANIVFRQPEPDEETYKIPAEDADGNVHALLRFSASGELLYVELLDAQRQIPASLREASD